MARIIAPQVEPKREAAWRQASDEVVTIALDRNEVEAVKNATAEYHARCKAQPSMTPTSLNASGARVHEALVPVLRALKS